MKEKELKLSLKDRSEIIDRTKNALANSKNAGTNSTGEGVNAGPGNQGVTSGSVDSNVRGDGNGLGDKGISYRTPGQGFSEHCLHQNMITREKEELLLK